MPPPPTAAGDRDAAEPAATAADPPTESSHLAGVDPRVLVQLHVDPAHRFVASDGLRCRTGPDGVSGTR